MVVINMNLMPLKVIGKEVCLWTIGLFGLSKDPELKRCPNIWSMKESKIIMDSMNMEEGGVHHKKLMVDAWNSELNLQRLPKIHLKI
jgi:hypothetical protein